MYEVLQVSFGQDALVCGIDVSEVSLLLPVVAVLLNKSCSAPRSGLFPCCRCGKEVEESPTRIGLRFVHGAVIGASPEVLSVPGSDAFALVHGAAVPAKLVALESCFDFGGNFVGG